jgi:hypothetical protein
VPARRTYLSKDADTATPTPGAPILPKGARETRAQTRSGYPDPIYTGMIMSDADFSYLLYRIQVMTEYGDIHTWDYDYKWGWWRQNV